MTVSSSLCICRCIHKMKNETLLFTFQQMLHPLLQNADTLPRSLIPSGSLSSLHPVSTNRHLFSQAPTQPTRPPRARRTRGGRVAEAEELHPRRGPPPLSGCRGGVGRQWRLSPSSGSDAEEAQAAGGARRPRVDAEARAGGGARRPQVVGTAEHEAETGAFPIATEQDEPGHRG
jgi:hypothetical protein